MKFNHKDWREKRAVAAMRLRNVIIARTYRAAKSRIDLFRKIIGGNPHAIVAIAKCKVKGRRICTFRRIVVFRGTWARRKWQI